MLYNQEQYSNFIKEFTEHLYLLKSDIPYTHYIFLCVGSDKVIGDCFGPIVGQNLEEKFKNTFNNIKIIGTLEKPISAINIEEEITKIYKLYENPCIIAIDSALSKEKDVGKIIVSNEKLHFAKSVRSKGIQAGDISIKGIVARDYKISRYNFNALQNTSLSVVIKLANIVSDGICNVIKYR